MARSMTFTAITLAALVVHALPAPATQVCPTLRTSVDSSGGQGNDASADPYAGPSISPDGRFVVFASEASNLVPGDTNGSRDVFVHDRALDLTERVSVSSGGAQASGDSGEPSISADGRYVAFASGASNLVPGDTNGDWDIFVHDRLMVLTRRVSVDSNGGQSNSLGSAGSSISSDGRYVAFMSTATNLVPGDTNGTTDAFVHDRTTGQTERVSVDSNGAQAAGWSQDSRVSPDGNLVAFWSSAPNLVPGDTNGVPDVFVHNRTTGETARVSLDSSGAEANAWSMDPSISADSGSVVFTSGASNLVPGDANGLEDIFVHELLTGQTERVSVGSNGAEADAPSIGASISADGGTVTFTSAASNLVAGDTNGFMDVFVHDRSTGETRRASVSSGGAQGDDQSPYGALASDSRAVVFASDAGNLVPGDTNGVTDIFVRDAHCPVGVPYCFGDGSGTPCPCGNAGGAGEGCANSSGLGGRLESSGAASVAADDLGFEATQLLPGQPALLFAGENAVNGGDGIVFGDGLRCSGMSIVRLGVMTPGANGALTWGPGLGAAGAWMSGDTRYFQVWYRDPNGPCGLGFDLTNGAEVTFAP